ncbi:MAG TPA: prephenate dehydrogenase [Longimicrobiales bacterium]|nr:prephenate dehydrogenase [Longimicrobiales bacterium]
MTVETSFARIGIVGLGLMGGSLARALAGLPRPPEVAAWSPDPAERARALAAGVLAHAPERAEGVLDADLVVYAVPLRALLSLMEAHASLWPPGAVVSDVGSLKAPVRDAAGPGAAYVGAHPMAGGHASGFDAARADLFEGARVWLTPGAGASPAEVAAVAGLWRALGARPETIDAHEHDRRMSLASHLPQAASSALALALAEHAVAPAELGPGGRDATRLAASSPDLWVELLLAARRADMAALDGFQHALAALRDAIERGDEPALRALLERARAWKEGGQ